jgi:hypothetical protein
VFLVNGSLLMTPLFPRSGPGESGSPMSAVHRKERLLHHVVGTVGRNTLAAGDAHDERHTIAQQCFIRHAISRLRRGH